MGWISSLNSKAFNSKYNEFLCVHTMLPLYLVQDDDSYIIVDLRSAVVRVLNSLQDVPLH